MTSVSALAYICALLFVVCVATIRGYSRPKNSKQRKNCFTLAIAIAAVAVGWFALIVLG